MSLLSEQKLTARIQVLSKSGQMRPVLLGILVVLLGSCDLGPERWEPWIIELSFERNGETSTIALNNTSPIIELSEGDHISVSSFRLRMLPIQRSHSGVTMTKFSDVPPVPNSALDIKARAIATFRNTKGIRHCWDVSREVQSAWREVQPQSWDISVAALPWIFNKNMDQLRVDVEFKRNDQSISERYNINSVDLKDSSVGRLSYNMSHNIFLYLFDLLMGVEECGD